MDHRFLLGSALAIGAMTLSACSSGRSPLEVRAAGQGAAPLQSGAQMAQAARQHLDAEQHGLAVGQFRELLISDPDSAFAHNGLAVAYDAIGRTDLARRRFERARLLAPENATYARNVARLASRDAQLALAKAQASRDEQARIGETAPQVYRLRMASTGGASLAPRPLGVAIVTRGMRASLVTEGLSSGAPQPFTLERVKTGALFAAGGSPALERVSHYEVRIVARYDGDRLAMGKAHSGAAQPPRLASVGRKTLWQAGKQAGSDLQLALQAAALQLACQRAHSQSSTAITGMIWMNQRCAS